jgi:aminoglycoside phosphotransferase (APT) family kinase protein
LGKSGLGESVILIDYEVLHTATSTTVLRVKVRTPKGVEMIALRLYDNADWLAEAPDLVQHEAAALALVTRLHLPAPRLLCWTQVDVGFGVPCLAMSWLDGEVVVRPRHLDSWLVGLADTLADIHGTIVSEFPWHFRTWVDAPSLAVPDWTQSPSVWRKALDRWREGPPAFTATLIHRDFHPTNILCNDTGVVGVVDWPNACIGPPAIDVAHCSYNLALMYGLDAVKSFRAAYGRARPEHRQDIYWDIDSLFDKRVVARYYAPWREFGLAAIDRAELRRRVDAYLEYCMS